jgi:DNA-binding CsgD family transcriptional regulator
VVRNKKVTFSLNAGIVLFFIIDIIVDAIYGDLGPEFFVELVVFAMAAVLLFYEMASYYRVSEKYLEEKDRASRLSGELTAYIEARFENWRLTKTEREIAWFLVRGYSFAEIAQARNTKEKTVRQQATGLYAKSETGNRSEFVALFIEDLLASSHLNEAANPSTAD